MSAQQDIVSKYGMPGPIYQAKYCTIWQIDAEFPWFPARRMLINTDFKERWQHALKNLEADNLHHEIHTFDGCYSERNVRGKSAISLHSWAMAWDLNANIERLGQINTHWTPEFIAIVMAAGIYWGGNFKTRKDPMHFALYNG